MSSYIKTTGIVTKTSNYKENDKMVTIFSKEYGKMDVASRGCKKQNSPMNAISSIFAYGEFEIYCDKDRKSLNQGEVFHSFYDITKDIEKFAVAHAMANACQQVATPNEEHPALFALLINLLNYLEKDIMTPMDAVFIFFIKLCDIDGIRPNTGCCVLCGSENIKKELFSIEEGGLVCNDCKLDYLPISVDESFFLKINEVLMTKNKDLPSIKLEATKRDLKIMLKFIKTHLDINETAFDYLKKIDFL